MTQPVDFLLIYELKVRELDSVCLLAAALEKRGHSVAIMNLWHGLYRPHPEYDAKVVVMPACYNDGSLYHVAGLAKHYQRAVNLCWEQVRPEDDTNDPDSDIHIKGLAKRVPHLMWGQQSKNWMQKASDIPSENLPITGYITLDFMRPKFASFFIGRDQLLEKHGIPTRHRVVLFVASFNFVDLPEDRYKSLHYGRDMEEYLPLMIESSRQLNHWFETAVAQCPNTTIIYRPHPSEADHPQLVALTEKYDNLRIIGEDSIRQWILSTDMLCFWCSSSVVEAYAAKKEYYVLRPLALPQGMDIPYYFGCNCITTEADFLCAVIGEIPGIQAPKPVVENYYDIGETLTYQRICVVLETELAQCNGRTDLMQAVAERFSPQRLEAMFFENQRRQITAQKKFKAQTARQIREFACAALAAKTKAATERELAKKECEKLRLENEHSRSLPLFKRLWYDWVERSSPSLLDRWAKKKYLFGPFLRRREVLLKAEAEKQLLLQQANARIAAAAQKIPLAEDELVRMIIKQQTAKQTAKSTYEASRDKTYIDTRIADNYVTPQDIQTIKDRLASILDCIESEN